MQANSHAGPAVRTEEEDVVLGQLLRVIIDDIGRLIAIRIYCPFLLIKEAVNDSFQHKNC